MLISFYTGILLKTSMLHRGRCQTETVPAIRWQCLHKYDLMEMHLLNACLAPVSKKLSVFYWIQSNI